MQSLVSRLVFQHTADRCGCVSYAVSMIHTGVSAHSWLMWLWQLRPALSRKLCWTSWPLRMTPPWIILRDTCLLLPTPLTPLRPLSGICWFVLFQGIEDTVQGICLSVGWCSFGALCFWNTPLRPSSRICWFVLIDGVVILRYLYAGCLRDLLGGAHLGTVFEIPI